jgi:DNA polymerase IV
VVTGDPKERRRIVLAANYIAKNDFGIYTTMPLWEAKKIYPFELAIDNEKHIMFSKLNSV